MLFYIVSCTMNYVIQLESYQFFIEFNKSFIRNGSSNNPFSLEKTIQKYQQLAKDALSSGDPILSENYLQHADHFERRLSEIGTKNKNPVIVKSDKNSVDENDQELKN